MKQTEIGIFNQISNALAEHSAPLTQPIPVSEIGFTGATAVSGDTMFDFDPTQDVLLFDGEPVNENGLPSGVQAFENTNGDTVVQFISGETQTLHGASYDEFLDFIDDISINAAADTVSETPMYSPTDEETSTSTDEDETPIETVEFIDFGDGKMLPVLQFDPEAQHIDLEEEQDDFDNLFLF